MTLEEKLENVRKRYELGNISSYEKETEELDLRFGTEELRKTDEYQLNKLRIEKEYGKITQLEYDTHTAEILHKNSSAKERELAMLEVQLKNGLIEKVDYICQVKELEGEPYAAIHLEYGDQDGEEVMVMDVKHNHCFVKMLLNKGFEGATEEEIVDNWARLRMASMVQSDDYELRPYNDVVMDGGSGRLG